MNEVFQHSGTNQVQVQVQVLKKKSIYIYITLQDNVVTTACPTPTYFKLKSQNIYISRQCRNDNMPRLTYLN